MARYQSLFFNGASSASDVVTLSGKGNKGRWNDVVIKGAAGECSGLILQNGASVYLSNVSSSNPRDFFIIFCYDPAVHSGGISSL